MQFNFFVFGHNHRSTSLQRRKLRHLPGRRFRLTFQFRLDFRLDGGGGTRLSLLAALFLCLFGGCRVAAAPLEQLEEFTLLAGHDRFRQFRVLLPNGEIRFTFLLFRRNGRIDRRCSRHGSRSRRQSRRVRSRDPRYQFRCFLSSFATKETVKFRPKFHFYDLNLINR